VLTNHRISARPFWTIAASGFASIGLAGMLAPYAERHPSLLSALADLTSMLTVLGRSHGSSDPLLGLVALCWLALGFVGWLLGGIVMRRRAGRAGPGRVDV